MRLSRPSTPVILWLVAATAFVALMVERATTPVLSRDAFISLLADCGTSGRPIDESVRALGLTERAWGRAVSRYAPDPAVAQAIEQRLAQAPAEAAPSR